MKKNGIFFTPLKCFVAVESDENKNKQKLQIRFRVVNQNCRLLMKRFQ